VPACPALSKSPWCSPTRTAATLGSMKTGRPSTRPSLLLLGLPKRWHSDSPTARERLSCCVSALFTARIVRTLTRDRPCGPQGHRRRYRPLGDAYSSNIHADDAAAAVVAAVNVDGGLYNVVEDEPLRRTDQLKALAEAVGLVRLHSAGPLLAVVGGSRTSAMARSQRVSNHRFRAAALWQPKYASVRRGWPAVVAAM